MSISRQVAAGLEPAIGKRDYPTGIIVRTSIRAQCNYPGIWICAMGFLKHTVEISRADLTRDCLQQLRLWPGCETVAGVAILGDLGGRFTVHVIDYGASNKRLADRAVRCIQREKLRRHHLRAD